ncbi:hypothetical protein ACOMHN_051852 [Nucella lapillus]
MVAATKGRMREEVEEQWCQYVRHWFPDLQTHTHFVPPVYMYRTRHMPHQVEGQEVHLKKAPVSEQKKGTGKVLLKSDVKEDLSQEHVLHNLRELSQAQGEVMFVLCQLQFQDYLDNPIPTNPSCGAAAVPSSSSSSSSSSSLSAKSFFPTPGDLKQQNKNRGDFDVFIIHRTYGFLVGEIKAVDESVEDSILNKRVKKAASQLAKCQDVLRHVTSDMTHSPRVQMTMIFPHISVQRLQQLISANPKTAETLRTCLAVGDPKDVAAYCLCSDHMSSSATPHDINEDVLRHLKAWWQRCMCNSGPDPCMSDDLYELLVARFVGPATTVRVHCVTEPRVQLRTKSEAISEVGHRLTTLSLYPQQLYLLQSGGLRVFLHGPPGTGKTTLLLLKALQWLREGQIVFVVSTLFQSLAASNLVHHQLFKTMSPEHKDNLRFLALELFDSSTIEYALMTLIDGVLDKSLCIIADEAGGGKPFRDLCTQLYEREEIEELRLWAAAMELDSLAPCLTPFPLTCPLRCPPVVTREVEKAKLIQDKKIPGYTVAVSPMPCDGPEVIRLWHSLDHLGEQQQQQQREGEGEGDGQDGTKLMDCVQCGHNVGQQLKKLGVGCSNTPNGVTAPLTYRDAVVLTWFGEPHDELVDPQGNVGSKPASGFVRGLRETSVPVRVLVGNDSEGVKEVSIMSGIDAIVVTDVINVWGLERKVVVWLGDQFWDDIAGRLQAMSRSTAQLIWVAIEK